MTANPIKIHSDLHVGYVGATVNWNLVNKQQMDYAFLIIEDSDCRDHLRQLIDKLFANNLDNVAISDVDDGRNEVDVGLNTAYEKEIDLGEKTTLFVPGRVRFTLDREGKLQFVDAPRESMDEWKEIVWDKEAFVLTTTLLGEDKVRTIPKDKFLDSLS